MAYFCYIVRCADGSLYTGLTTDLVRRVKQHNAGKGAAYTRLHGPVELVYAEPQPDRSTATIREAQIKRYAKEKKNKLISQITPDLLCQLTGESQTQHTGVAGDPTPAPTPAKFNN